MDVLLRLRLALWLMVLSLWGLMAYQFLQQEGSDIPRMLWLGKRPTQTRHARANFFPPRPSEEDLFAKSAPAAADMKATRARLPGLERIPASAPSTQAIHNAAQIMAGQGPEPLEAPTPDGFTKTKTRHFIVYTEGGKASPGFLQILESLHSNIMLDLAAFSPWAHDERVSIYLFRDQDSYRQVTGRPVWSGGASSIRRRKIYLYDSEETLSILAHELCHIYFDSFFLGGQTNPLWLSEGMATLIQTERGLSAPNWLKENLETLHRGGGYSIADLMRLENTNAYGDDQVRLWYTQSYSVVRFLMRSQYRSSFYRFCRYMRQGAGLRDSLYRAYGMPFDRMKALEYAWRHDLTKK